jgi:hypothetical protein
MIKEVIQAIEDNSKQKKTDEGENVPISNDQFEYFKPTK